MPIPLILIGVAAASAALGVGAGAVGAKKMYDANSMIKAAQSKYKKKEESLKATEKETLISLDDLGQTKLEVWKSFDTFSELYESIQNRPVFEGSFSRDELNLSTEDLKEIKTCSVTALEFLGSGALSIGGGALAGVAAYGGTMTFGAASTGTAIASLSGAAATNATLATIGGGSLATGGLGMAGGTMILGGMVAGPALAFSGILLAFKGCDSEAKARKISKEVDDAINEFVTIEEFLNKLRDNVDTLNVEIVKLYSFYIKFLKDLDSIIKKSNDYEYFSYDDSRVLEGTILLTKLLKHLTTIDILINKGDKQEVAEKKLLESLDMTKAQIADFNYN